jgi:hypothetical protein
VGRVTAGKRILASRRGAVDRRGWSYLGGAVVATLVAGLFVPILAYAVLAGAAIGAWVTQQHAVIRWTLTVLAVVLVAALVLGFAGSTEVSHGSTRGPITRNP